jgi:pimeloyl-ACP methyl ester carboxylesterase
LLGAACSGDKPEPTPSATAAPTETPAPTVTPSPTPAPNLPPPPAIDWVRCDPYECAEFGVPVDYLNPARGDFRLALLRVPARNQGAKIGSLLINNGGPGASPVDFLRAVAFAIPAAIRDRFDLVAFDPRGIGASNAIRCGDRIQDLLALNPDPETDAEWQEILEATRAFADLCAERAGTHLDFYGTENVARDMDRIRQGLGEDRLNYLGYSYGTSIGQVYADLFPQNVRAMVLDGALDNSLKPDQRNLEQILAFEAALGRFLQYCRNTACFATDPEVAVRTLIDRAEAEPIPAPGQDRPLREGEAVWGILGSLYARSLWPGLANAIRDALNGDGSRMIRLVDRDWQRKADGSYSNFFEANSAVNCIDLQVDRDPDHHRRLSEDLAGQAPFFGSWGGYLNLTCALWKAKPSPLRVPKATGAPPILVIGNTGDPATPLKWAVALSNQLESGVLLTNDAEGHTAYLQGDVCIERAVNAYLLELTVPDEGARCGNAGIQPVPPLP